jgi:hypothetical protein
MTISDFFCTSSFLFSIAIIIILTGCIFAYINYKMTEQDHKLTSMVNLVSILAQDLHFVKSKVNYSQKVEPNVLQYPSQLVGGENNSCLISVSDNEDLDDEDDDDLDDDEDEDDIDDDLVEDDFDFITENTQDHIKILNLSLANDNVQNEIEDNLQIEELNSNNYSDLVDVDVKTIHFINEEDDLQENDVVENDDDIVKTDTNSINDELHFLKNVSITDLGDIQDLTSKPEYKKMSTIKLREVVISKGIITDASKLKKHEILKLLGDE